MSNRKAAEKVILTLLEQWCPGNLNVQFYKSRFESMTDRQFDEMLASIEEGQTTLAYVEPNLYDGPRVSVDGNLDFLEKLGHKTHQRIWMVNDDGTRTLGDPLFFITPQTVRRQAQHMVKKASIPKHSRTVDVFTGQPTGDSKGSKLSYPEVGVLDSLGLPATLEEFLVYRGGDTKGFAAMNSSVIDNGSVAFEQIEDRRSGVESVKTLSVFLKGAHLANNLHSGV